MCLSSLNTPIVGFLQKIEIELRQQLNLLLELLIHAWKDFIRDNSKEVIRRLEPFRTPLSENPVLFKYLLVIGRSAQKRDSLDMRKRLISLGSKDFHICTYDSFLSFYQNNSEDTKNIIKLSGNRFVFKYMHKFPTSLFGWLGPNTIGISKKQREKLISAGYDMQAWEKGTLLRGGTVSIPKAMKKLRNMLKSKNK